jgi:hypothetical protein
LLLNHSFRIPTESQEETHPVKIFEALKSNIQKSRTAISTLIGKSRADLEDLGSQGATEE